MGIEQLNTREIVSQSVNKKIDIPEFQREFVWDPEQVKLFAESLYRSYPVGSFLLWDSSTYQEAKAAQGTQASLWIVDGQQRTTALCLLLGMRPFWWSEARDWNKALARYDVLANVVPADTNDRIEFSLPNPIRAKEQQWVSVRRILSTQNIEDLTSLAQGVADRVVAQNPAISESATALFPKIHARMQRLWQIREREVPIVNIDHEVEDVAEIFARLNQAGTRVKEADVVLALAAVRNPGWVREQYLPFRDDLEDRGYDVDAGVFIRTMTGIGCGRARLIEVPKDFWYPANLPQAWARTRGTIAEVVKRMAQWGIASTDLLPSTNSLIPLFVLHHKWQGKTAYSFEKALRWFLLASRDGRYSGSAITSLNEDVRAVHEAPTFDAALAALLQRLRVSDEILPEEFLNRYDRAGNRFLRLMVYLLVFKREALDLVDRTRIGYDNTGSPVTAGFQPQWHHIYPRSVLRSHADALKLKDDDINALANITVLNERTNVGKLAAKPPAEYIAKFAIPPDVLRGHLVPDEFADACSDVSSLGSCWSLERYQDFLFGRAASLAVEGTALLRRLNGS